MELIAVIIIIGVLATLAIPAFSVPRERALGKEAQANLRLIQAAQKIYNMDNGFYYPYAESGTQTQNNITLINSYLKLSIPTTNWAYSVSASGSIFTAQADRNSTSCLYTIDNNDPAPSPNSITDCPQ